MPRQRKDLPDFARHLPRYILDPHAVTCADGTPVKASDEDPESTDPAIKLELAAVIEGVE